jgi:hypothetical protein
MSLADFRSFWSSGGGLEIFYKILKKGTSDGEFEFYRFFFGDQSKRYRQ